MDIQVYINSLGGTLPNPTKDEEYALIRKAQAAQALKLKDPDKPTAEEYTILMEGEAARQTIARSYFGLVYSCCSQLFGLGRSGRCKAEVLPDVLQTGMMGLFKAVSLFDLKLGYRLSTLAVVQIKCGLYALRANYNKNKATTLVTIDDTDTGAPETDALSALLYEVAIEGRESVTPDAEIHASERHNIIIEALSVLDPIEADIVSKRYGIGRDNAMAYGTIVRFYGHSLETIRGINNIALRKMYLYLSEKYGDVECGS